MGICCRSTGLHYLASRPKTRFRNLRTKTWPTTSRWSHFGPVDCYSRSVKRAGNLTKSAIASTGFLVPTGSRLPMKEWPGTTSHQGTWKINAGSVDSAGIPKPSLKDRLAISGSGDCPVETSRCEQSISLHRSNQFRISPRTQSPQNGAASEPAWFIEREWRLRFQVR